MPEQFKARIRSKKQSFSFFWKTYCDKYNFLETGLDDFRSILPLILCYNILKGRLTG